MKPTILTLLLTLFLFSCKKEMEVEPVKYNTPIDVYYTISGHNNVTKAVTVHLWSADQYGALKRLVRSFDTVIVGSGTIVLTQNDAPYIYCITSVRVECEGDILSLKVGTKTQEYYYNSMSCVSNTIELNNEFLTLYH